MRLDYQATGRNTEPLLEVLRAELPTAAWVLEVGSGSGQHGRAFVEALPGLRWQPSSFEAHERASIDAWADGHPRISKALDLDVRAHPWPVLAGTFEVLFSANMIHIAPWACTPALFEGAARALGPTGMVVLYGPFRVAGQPTAASNDAFDQSLRGRDPSWGIRQLEAVEEEATARGFTRTATYSMPANNLTVVFRRG